MTFTATWSDERIAKLVELHQDGWSGGMIAAHLGVSRNAVIGKIHRLGITRGNQQQRYVRKPGGGRSPAGLARKKRPGEYASKASERRAARNDVLREAAERERIQAMPDLVIPPEQRIALEDLPDRGNCRWPFGDGPFYFHKAPAVRGLPYCEFHCARAFNPVAPLRGIGPRQAHRGEQRKPGPTDYSPALREFDKMEIA